MHSAILGLVRGDVDDPTISSELERDTYPAIEADASTYLDGSRIYTGTAAGKIEVEEDLVYVQPSGIIVERGERLERELVVTEFIADLGAGWVGIDTSDAEWFWNYLERRKGVQIHRSVIDVAGFADHVRDYPSSNAWLVTQSREYDDDGEKEETSIDYHEAARLGDTVGDGETVQLGFSYRWDGGHVRGTIAASGYVAMYKDMADSTFGAWLDEQLMPFVELPEKYQSVLTGGEETAGEAAADGGNDE